MKKLFLILLLPCLLFAAGGDTLEFDAGVQAVTNDRPTDSDVNVFYHPMKDSIQSIINGRLGNINIAADAQIKPTKIDSADTLIMQRIRCDTLKSTISLLDTIISDSANITFLKSQDASIDTIAVLKADIDTILSCDTAYIQALKTNSFSPDTLTSDTAYIGHLQVDSINIMDTGSFTLTLTGCTTSPTGVAKYTKIGNVVHFYMPQITGVSNTTAATLTGLPERLRMISATNSFVVNWNRDNNADSIGRLVITNSDTITLQIGTSPTFTASNGKGVTPNNFSYIIR
jgi:hypothetical protein